MARPLRIHVPGGFHHVTLRGNHQQAIFFTDDDRELIGTLLADACASLGARVHGYCWMTNHIHLLVQVSDKPLGRVVQRFASRYAKAVQARLSTTGHLFERRYHGALIDVDRYLLAVIRYIHLNPVKAGLVRDPAAYRWSSHNVYLGRARCDWLTTSFIAELLGPSPSGAIARYRTLMESQVDGTPDVAELLEPGRHCQILGDEDFAARVTAAPRLSRPRKSLEELVAECVGRFSVPAELLASPSKSRRLAAARAWIAHQAVSGRAATISAVARLLNRTEGSIRQLMARYPRPAGD